MSRTTKDLIILALFNFLLTVIIWLPHLLTIPNFYGLDFSSGFSTIYRNFDGLEYAVIGKSFYDPQKIAQIPQSLPPSYFPSHFPGYAIAITIFAPLLGMLKSMLFTGVLFTILSGFSFYFLVKDFKLTSQPLWLSLVFFVLPARWVVTHSVGSSEPMFIFFTLTSIYFFLQFLKQPGFTLIFLSSLMGALGQLTRPPGILLFVALNLYFIFSQWEQIKKWQIISILRNYLNYLPLWLIPLTLVGVFWWFYLSLGDFMAYFHSGDNIHLTFPPFQVFNKNQFWVGDIWLEDIIYIFLLGLLAGLWLLKQKFYPLAFFVFTYLGVSTLVAHRDISRYVLPIFPFVLIAFERILTSKEFKIVLAILGLAIYLYSQNFIISNTAPIPNLEAYN